MSPKTSKHLRRPCSGYVHTCIGLGVFFCFEDFWGMCSVLNHSNIIELTWNRSSGLAMPSVSLNIALFCLMTRLELQNPQQQYYICRQTVFSRSWNCLIWDFEMTVGMCSGGKPWNCVLPLIWPTNDPWHSHQTRPDLTGGQDRLDWLVLPMAIKNLRLDLTVLFGLCNRMRGIPQVLNPFIVNIWV